MLRMVGIAIALFASTNFFFDFDSTAAFGPAQIQARVENKAPVPAEEEAARILDKHIAAIGGRDALKAIKSIEVETETIIMGGVSKSYRIEDKATRRFYQSTDGANGKMEMGFDGKRVWRKTPYFQGYLSDSDTIARNILKPEPELVDFRESGKQYTRVPNETIDGTEYLVIQTNNVDEAGRLIPFKLYFDPRTYLLSRTVAGKDITSTTIFEEYRKVGNITSPFVTHVKNPNLSITITVKSRKYDVPFDASRVVYDGGAAGPETTAGATPARNEATTAAPSPEETRLQTFELVWKKIDDSYWDRTFNGVDWKAVHDKYLPLAKAAPDNDQFHLILNRMVGELGQSHFRIRPASDVAGLHSNAGDLENGAVGLTVRRLDGRIVVVDVEKGYPAHQSGIRPGFIIAKVNGKTPDELLAEYRKKTGGYQLREEIQQVRAIGAALGGKPDTKVMLDLLDGDDKPVTLELVRKATPLNRVVEFEAKRLEGNIGYIRFSIFLGDVIERFEKALATLGDTTGLIVDLRGNPGGVGQMTTALAALLSSEDGSLGSYNFRYQSQPFAYKGNGKKAYPGKIVILMDELSGSSSEVFAGGLQENGRVKVVGMPSAGAVLPSLIEPLPTGGALQYAISSYATPKGVVLEGRGVKPDITVQQTRAALLQGKDAMLDRAVAAVK